MWVHVPMLCGSGTQSKHGGPVSGSFQLLLFPVRESPRVQYLLWQLLDRSVYTLATCRGSTRPASHTSWQVLLRPPKVVGAEATEFQGHLEFLFISSELIKGNFIRLESLTNFLFLSPSLLVSLIFFFLLPLLISTKTFLVAAPSLPPSFP